MVGKPNSWHTSRGAPQPLPEAIADELVGRALQALVAASEDAPALEELPLIEPGDVGLLPSVVEVSRTSRVVVDAGPDTPAQKVYFDNATHQSGGQRGWIWIDCSLHSSSKDSFVGAESKSELSCRVYIWHAAAARHDRGAHMRYEPDAAAMLAAFPTVRMTSF